MDEEVKKEKEKLLEEIKKKGYFKRLLSYNKPYWMIVVGLISSAIQGMVMPIYGIIYVKILFQMFNDDMDKIYFYLIIILIICL